MIYAMLICLAPVAIDGDTIRCGRSEEVIRIWGVNAPEKRTPTGPASTAHLTTLITGGLECEMKGASYNRVVAQCWNGYNVDISAAMLKDGFASEWCSYSKGYYGTCKK